jgi:hypothetical protein
MTPRHPPRALGGLTTPTGRRTRENAGPPTIGRPPRIAARRRLATRPAALSSNDHHSKGLTVVENDCHSLPPSLPTGLAARPDSTRDCFVVLRHLPPHCQRASAAIAPRPTPERIGHVARRRLAAGQGRGPSGWTAPARARRGRQSVDGPREGALEGSSLGPPRAGRADVALVGPTPRGQATGEGRDP